MRLLAFMHFYYSLFLSLSDNDYNFRPDLKTIIIDDPITSLDADNRYVLTNAINIVIAKLYDGNKDIQLFIFTHSSMDFHDFSYRFSNFIGQFIISKDIKGNINGREVSITNGDEAVAFELREKDANGKLLYFSTFIKFEVPLTVSLTYAKLYAVQADGKRILLEE